MRVTRNFLRILPPAALGLLLSLWVFSWAQLRLEGRGEMSEEDMLETDSTRSTYLIKLDPDECVINIEKKLNVSSLYEEELDERTQQRKASINSIANHRVGEFPNRGNPNRIREQRHTYTIPLNPQVSAEITSAQGYDSGILFSGVGIDPYTAEFFVGSFGRINRRWNLTTLTNSEDLGLDCNNAHVQPGGKYHYHGTPSAYLAALGFSGEKMQKVGYAADGFPIYYKFGYDASGNLIAHKSGYQLKKGIRPGDGTSAPNGPYDGRYFQDYEYLAGISELDACNGKWGKTPESDHEYYYLITDNFPSVPICFSGTPSKDFQKRRPGPQRRP